MVYFPVKHSCLYNKFVYFMVQFFFPVEILSIAPEMFLFLFDCFFFQSETVIYLVTEPVRPLEVQLNEEEKSDLAISWGLHQITVSIILNRYT